MHRICAKSEVLHLTEVFPAHPEGVIVVAVLVPRGNLQAQTTASPR